MNYQIILLCAIISLSYSNSIPNNKQIEDLNLFYDQEKNYYSENEGATLKPISTPIEKTGWWDMTVNEIKKPVKQLKNFFGFNSRNENTETATVASDSPKMTNVTDSVPVVPEIMTSTLSPTIPKMSNMTSSVIVITTQAPSDIDEDTTTVKSKFFRKN
ncbi:uncharacterized protein [Chironomus tepperi]|uniref:uncharacterized protein n=1 Tax=Chironomus tepperi TaxID=113505 RepID=UPI00391F95E5